MKKILLIYLCFLLPQVLWAQNEIFYNGISDSFALTRTDWQTLKQLDAEIKKIDVADGLVDQFLNLDNDMIRSKAISKVVFEDARSVFFYTLNNFTDFEQKRLIEVGLLNQLRNINKSLDKATLNVNSNKRVFEIAKNFVYAIKRNNVPFFIQRNASPELYALASFVENNKEHYNAIIQITADKYPELLLREIKNLNDAEMVNKIIAKSAHSQPKMILNYATSTAAERDIVRRSADDYVKALVQLADDCKTPLKAIFFLDDFYEKKLSIADIDKITENNDAYYKKLVEKVNLAQHENERQNIGKELNQQSKAYVHEMNELHFQSDGIRFKNINDFSASELYYIMVYGNDDFYTSSYLGTFRRYMQKLKPKNAYEFLENIHFNRFRTFLRLSGNFNTLDDFLNGMEKNQQEMLMKNFVNNLDQEGENYLENAIDVATTFSSVKKDSLRELIIEEIQRNRSNARIQGNTLGFRIYNILNIMFTENDSVVAAKLNIPPINAMPYGSMQNDSGEVVEQIYFPGDGDGKGVFNSFMSRHDRSVWKITSTPLWVKLESKGKNALVKYVNKPLDEPQDELAAKALSAYLDSMGIKPAILIQRGHSYHVSSALDVLNSHHKVVMLGACGGFNHLETIMNKSADAQIISSKQVGSGSVNWRILDYIDRCMLNGKDINWVNMWSELGKQMVGNDLFDDYVPPHKNLGSLFLKAFYRAELEDE